MRKPKELKRKEKASFYRETSMLGLATNYYQETQEHRTKMENNFESFSIILISQL